MISIRSASECASTYRKKLKKGGCERRSKKKSAVSWGTVLRYWTSGSRRQLHRLRFMLQRVKRDMREKPTVPSLDIHNALDDNVGKLVADGFEECWELEQRCHHEQSVTFAPGRARILAEHE